ncbi:MAG TPA: class I SAM-dependent methyltransferase [Blastocatellia bacterium]|nr:class I SAM-dependent methyltransferase [Blastocatellia bacterium]
MRKSISKIEYGDFQTPPELARQICYKLSQLGIAPEIIVEPTCGSGAFIKASLQCFAPTTQILGIEINPNHLEQLRQELRLQSQNLRVSLRQADFFSLDWAALLRETKGNVLVLGNLPWVTNSAQGMLGGMNLPQKTNFLFQKGMDALTGKSNFDISEWMLIQLAEALQERQGTLAMLCKTSVARKLMQHLYQKQCPVATAALYKIDAAQHFGVAVDAGLLVCRFDKGAGDFTYTIYSALTDPVGCRTGWRKNVMVSNLLAFDETQELFGNSACKWRSGIKHDCAEVMELTAINGQLVNGIGEIVSLEDDFLYPLLKGADVANHRHSTNRYLLVPQKSPGEDTRGLQTFAPRTWAYLEAHADYFHRRKSRIYQLAPPFSVFGIGSYSFAPWKIAICGLYKKLDFNLIGPLYEKPIVFDDTVYFLSFATEAEAREVFAFLTREKTLKFLDSMIFWDEKRPVKSGILNNLKLPILSPQLNWLSEMQ